MNKIPPTTSHQESPLIQSIDGLSLKRFPITKDENLKAWNAADEYLVDWCKQQKFTNINSTFIINDQFGALSCCFSEFTPYYWSDSFLSRTAINNNIEGNKLPSNDQHINFTNRSLEKQRFDLVIIRIPKHNSLLEFQLSKLRSFIHPDTIIVASGMTKEIHKSTLKIFETYLGSTNTSLAKKKARLIFSKFEREITQNIVKKQIKNYTLERTKLISYGLPGVFSRESLDIGSRVLLGYLPETKATDKLIDLGCGTGILGTSAAMDNPELEVTFTDESWLAVESAKITFEKNTGKKGSYLVTNVLDGLKDSEYHFILCNPPFHQQNVQTLSIANKMFKQAAIKLRNSGELRVVANRHLKYRPMLEQYFAQVKIISNDAKFVVWLATKPKHK